MTQIACVGLNAREAGITAVEAVVRSVADDWDGWERRLGGMLGARESVLLRTCNRVEFWFAGHALDLRGTQHRLSDVSIPWRLRDGEAALHHLLRVSCSLESLSLGEDQILGQVRRAFLGARERRSTGPVLELAFQRALRLGKRTRGTPLATAGADVPRRALRFARSALFPCAPAPSRPVALLGTGQMARALLDAWPKHAEVPLCIVSRDLDRALELAAPRGATARTLDSFQREPGRYSAVFAATSCDAPLIDAHWAREHVHADAPVVDLGLPRNVADLEGNARAIDLETLQREERAGSADLDAGVAMVEQWIETAVADLRARFLRRARTTETRELVS